MWVAKVRGGTSSDSKLQGQNVKQNKEKKKDISMPPEVRFYGYAEFCMQTNARTEKNRPNDAFIIDCPPPQAKQLSLRFWHYVMR